MITSSQNAKIKLVRALQKAPRQRLKESAFVAEGVRLLEEAYAANWPFQFVLFSDELNERGRELIGKLQVEGLEVEEIAPRLLQSVSETENSQGVLAVLKQAPLSIPHPLNFVLILDRIRDPGNLGALLRAAAAAGVQAVYLPPETTDAFAPKVVRAGMGAHFRLPIHSMSWQEVGQRTKGLQVYLAEMDGQVCWDTDLCQPLALIIGGEAQGASQAARALAPKKIGVPMAETTESLNAAVAGAILMFEVVRQRSNVGSVESI